eukprot:scaffold77607_cov48-Phaeocystis_antarctica.AAC.1
MLSPARSTYLLVLADDIVEASGRRLLEGDLGVVVHAAHLALALRHVDARCLGGAGRMRRGVA